MVSAVDSLMMNTLKIIIGKKVCDEAFRIASVNLESKPAPAGEMKVVLGAGWPAILIHESYRTWVRGRFLIEKKNIRFFIISWVKE